MTIICVPCQGQDHDLIFVEGRCLLGCYQNLPNQRMIFKQVLVSPLFVEMIGRFNLITGYLFLWCISYVFFINLLYTLPKTTIAPDRRYSQNESHLPHPVFQVRAVSSREGKYYVYYSSINQGCRFAPCTNLTFSETKPPQMVPSRI